MVGVDNILSKC